MEAEIQLKESTVAELERTKVMLVNLQERFQKLVVICGFYRAKANRLSKGFIKIRKFCQLLVPPPV